MAELSVSTIKTPKSTRKIMIGANHHFFLSFINSHISQSIEIFDILFNQADFNDCVKIIIR